MFRVLPQVYMSLYCGFLGDISDNALGITYARPCIRAMVRRGTNKCALDSNSNANMWLNELLNLANGGLRLMSW